MKSRQTIVAFAVAGAVAAGGYGLYRLGVAQGMSAKGGAGAPAAMSAEEVVDPSGWGIPEGEEATRRHLRDGLAAGRTDPVTGREILYYHDPMVPGQKFEAPGKSPFMDMMLVPSYAGSEGADAGTITISPRIAQNLGMRTAEVVSAPIASAVTAVGVVDWNENERVVVQARATGFVEKLHVRAALDRVQAGDALVDLYVPEWVAVQEEFLALRSMQGDGIDVLVAAARQRMRQAGMSDAQIRAVERGGRVEGSVTLRAPRAGVVTELAVREGMTVMAGATLARIDGFASVWVHAEVPDSQSSMLRPGAPVSARTQAHPDRSFEGTLQAVLPQLSAATRTVRARVVLDNAAGLLAPGMVMQLRLDEGVRGDFLQVPSEAVIRSGRRNLVMVAEEAGRFRPVEVETGIEADGVTQILDGLEAGQKVVVSGQFLIDSEASLKGVEARSGAAAMEPVEPVADTYRSDALVEAVDGDMLTLTHPPIPALKWPAMTMDFRLAPQLDASGIEPGQAVEFEFRMQDGDVPSIVDLRPVEGAAR